MADPSPSSSGDAPQAFLGRIFRFLRGRRNSTTLRDSLEEVIEEYQLSDEGGRLSADERQMLFNILRQGELRTEDIMVPRADIDAVDVTAGLDELLQAFSDAGRSRLLVYRDSLDDVIGIIHAKDLMRALAAMRSGATPPALIDIQRPVLFVAPSMRVMDLLARMRAGHTHLAVVVDEYGGTDGLVTIEDLIEQVVGDIEDEVKTEQPLLDRPDGADYYDADARVTIEDLGAALGVALLDEDSEDDVETIGGLVFTLAGRIPDIGEVIAHQAGFHFEVVDAEPRRITKIRVHLRPPEGRGVGAAAE